MGQYWRVIAKDRDGKVTVYDRSVDGEYTAAKLMEHSWWGNPFCRALCATIVDNPRRIAWVGDYADYDLDDMDIGFKYEDVWGDDAPDVGLASTEFSMDDVKYLVDDTERQYVDLAKYKAASEESGGWVIHPLPILTCVGNGHGGGDYHPGDGLSGEFVGAWCFDRVYLSNTLPDGYEEISPVFREN